MHNGKPMTKLNAAPTTSLNNGQTSRTSITWKWGCRLHNARRTDSGITCLSDSRWDSNLTLALMPMGWNATPN